MSATSWEPCNAQRHPVPGLDHKLTGYSPTGVEQFGGFIEGTDKQNLAYLCNDGAVAVLYDCVNRIPLYSATMMDEQQLNAAYQRPDVGFKQSSLLEPDFQANNADYEGSSNVRICYQHYTDTSPALIDSNWYKALNPGKAVKPYQSCPSVLTDKGPINTRQTGLSKAGARKTVVKKKERQRTRKPSPINTNMIKLITAIHKGHMIARSTVRQRVQGKDTSHIHIYKHYTPVWGS